MVRVLEEPLSVWLRAVWTLKGSQADAEPRRELRRFGGTVRGEAMTRAGGGFHLNYLAQ
jgi:hypothetical protein